MKNDPLYSICNTCKGEGEIIVDNAINKCCVKCPDCLGMKKVNILFK